MDQPSIVLPSRRGLYFGGDWHSPRTASEVEVFSPATGGRLASIEEASAQDIDAAVAAAQEGYRCWRDVHPFERARLLREAAAIIRANAEELATLEAIDCGNPVDELRRDVELSAMMLEFFGGLVTEMKGASVPVGPDAISFSVREPLGVVARIAPFNHPFIFSVGRIAAPLAAGNAIIVKPPEQAPLSALRTAELIGGVFPPGVLNVLPGGREVGAALVAHPGVAMIALTGSVATGKAVMRTAADGLKRVILELGGKNALLAMPDADPDKVAAGMIRGMNFTWCGQSCGSTSRAFVHEDIYDAVLERLPALAAKYRPGLPTDPTTTMGSLVSQAQLKRVLGYVESAKAEGARLICGGKAPDDPALAQGSFPGADGLRRRDDGDADRARGDFRPGAFGAALERRAGGDAAGQPGRIRPDLLGIRARHRQGAPDGGARRGRFLLDQRRGPPCHRLALRRLQAVGHRQGGMPGGAAGVHAGEEYLHQPQRLMRRPG